MTYSDTVNTAEERRMFRLDSLLLGAVLEQDADNTRRFLEAGGDVDLISGGPEGHPLVFTAAGLGDPEIIEILLANGAHPESMPGEASACPGMSPLTHAASKGHRKAVAALHAAGASLDVYDEDLGKTPLLWAVSEGHVDMAVDLIEFGVNVNQAAGMEEITPLIAAIWSRNRAMAGKLIEHGAGVNAMDLEGHTPLHHAQLAGDKKMQKWLIEQGAVLNLPKSDGTGRSAQADGQHEEAQPAG